MQSFHDLQDPGADDPEDDDPGADDYDPDGHPSPKLSKLHYVHLAELISGHKDECGCTPAPTPPTRIDRTCEGEQDTGDNGDETPPEEETS